MKKPAILLVLIAVLVLILGATGCDNSGQQSTRTPNTSSANTYTLVTREKGDLQLKLLKEWSGTGNKKFFFDVSPGPFVVDWSSSQTSQLGASFMMDGGKVDVGDLHTFDFYCYDVGQRGYAVVNESGHFIVEIESSGCEWTVRVGTE